MKQSISKRIILFWGLIFMFGMAGCEEEAEPVKEDEELEIADFAFLPEQPTMKDEVSLLFSGCRYYQTASVSVGNDEILVRKHFNSRLMWPCELVNDTIPLGKLKKGEYSVTLKIIDLNPLAADSVFHSQTKNLTVTNK